MIVQRLTEIFDDGSQVDYFLFFEQGRIKQPLLILDQFDLDKLVEDFYSIKDAAKRRQQLRKVET